MDKSQSEFYNLAQMSEHRNYIKEYGTFEDQSTMNIEQSTMMTSKNDLRFDEVGAPINE